MYGAEYLSLEDLLDQDPSAYEFFQTLSPEAMASFSSQMRRAGLME